MGIICGNNEITFLFDCYIILPTIYYKYVITFQKKYSQNLEITDVTFSSILQIKMMRM